MRDARLHAPRRVNAATLLRATRPGFLGASVLPVLIGTAWGLGQAGHLDVMSAALAVLATALVHAASNVYNDVSDELLGTDRANVDAIPPYTGGSRMIQDGLLSLAGMGRLALGLGLAGLAAGGLLALRHGPGVLLFGLAGLGLGVAYSLPGLRLSSRGLGELAIAVAFGLLPVCGAAWLQTGRLDGNTLLLALPVCAWVAAIILANEVPDARADGATGKHTLAVRLGAATGWLYALMPLLALGAWYALVQRGALPAWSLALPALLVVPSLQAARDLAGDRAALTRAIRLTLGVHLAGCLGLFAVLLLSAGIRV